MPASLAIDVFDLAGTQRLAATIGERARAGDAILLEGGLGAGKSAFARALLRHAAGDPALDVPSPTFTLVQSYDLPNLRAHHFDLWRLAGPEALVELGWEDALRDLVIVEWPDRLGALRPAAALTVTLTTLSEDARRLSLLGWDDRLGGLT